MTSPQIVPDMYLLAAFLLLFSSHAVHSGEQTEHRDFQYNSVVDPLTGQYNFAYDTGNDNEIAHSTHMQYRDASGVVRGRYGYTDPRGKLRVVEYEAGPNGFVARGDVGPDSSPHDQTPETQVPQTAPYTQEDLESDPRPVQMAGWDPMQDPMGQPVSSVDSDPSPQGVNGTEVGGSDVDEYFTTNATRTDAGDVYVPIINPYDYRYPRLFFSMNEDPNAGRELESDSSQTAGDENNPEVTREEYPVAPPLNINDIDVNPNDIRQAESGQVLTARSADGDTARSVRTLPYSYRNYVRQTRDHDGEIAARYVSAYIPSHGHYHYVKLPHDHEAEKRYASNRQTHDHDAERRYYIINRQTHDHDAEKRYANVRQTHDHDAEMRRYYRNRQTHDHDAELRRYYDYRRAHNHGDEAAHTIYHQNNPNRRRIYYKDNHSMVPHEHYNDIYHNDRSHQHSDVHLYGRSQALEVPPTAKPAQLKYISSDKYHDKYYYWTD